MLNSEIKNYPVLVIGAGSIGERHIRNLWQAGFKNIIVYRQRNFPFRDITNAKPKIFFNWKDVINQNCFAGIICTPTNQHISQIYDCVKEGMHVLVEKPLWHKIFNKDELIEAVKKNNVLLQVGYMLRFHPLLKKVKCLIDEKKFGNVRNIQTYWGDYLPDWHPYEDYRESYAANKNSGGGVALTLSHDLDVVNWLMNSNIKKYCSFHNYNSALEVNADCACDINLLYENYATAHVHVNFFQKVPQRWYKILLDEAVIDINYFNSTMKVETSGNTSIETLENFDRNDLFLSQQKDFFERITENNYTDYSTQQIEQSHNIIKICSDE